MAASPTPMVPACRCPAQARDCYCRSSKSCKSYGARIRLGSIDQIERFTPVPALSGRAIRQIACGECHTLALTTQGEILASGWNRWGQLGIAERSNRREFGPIPALSERQPVQHVAAGVGFSAVVGSDGDVYCFGVNLAGQLGQGYSGEGAFPFFVEEDWDCANSAAIDEKAPAVATAAPELAGNGDPTLTQPRPSYSSTPLRPAIHTPC